MNRNTLFTTMTAHNAAFSDVLVADPPEFDLPWPRVPVLWALSSDLRSTVPDAPGKRRRRV